MSYIKQNNPFVVPTTGGKLIEEHFGLATTYDQHISIAHKIAPQGWSEPFQNPGFNEYTLVSKGRKLLEVDGKKVEVSAGQSILIKKNSRVRYSNPFNEASEYWSVCMPAFSLETAKKRSTLILTIR